MESHELWKLLPQSCQACGNSKSNGGTRPLGIPTIEDRISQMAVVMAITPRIDPLFHEDSYGYRPNKSAHDALTKARERSMKYPWVLDMDISKFFDTINHKLLMKAVCIHVKEKWMLLYIERWLKVPYQTKDGKTVERTNGVPQGSVIGPVLANLFLHYVFDMWMLKNYPSIPFERYADDTICHLWTERQAQHLKSVLIERFEECGLKLNENKTKIVYCKDSKRTYVYSNTSFDYLGFTYRPRRAYNNKTGQVFTGFLPAISKKSTLRIKAEIRDWHLHRRIHNSLQQISDIIGPQVRGWLNYYSIFGKKEIGKLMRYLNEKLAKFVKRKFKRLAKCGGSLTKARKWLSKAAFFDTKLFVHWTFGYISFTKVH